MDNLLYSYIGVDTPQHHTSPNASPPPFNKLTLLILGEIPPNDFINSCPFLSGCATTHTTLGRHDGGASSGDERSTSERGKHCTGSFVWDRLRGRKGRSFK